MQSQRPQPTGFHRVSAGSLPIYSAVNEGRTILYAPRLVCVLHPGLALDALLYVAQLASEGSAGEHPRVGPRSCAWQAAVRVIQAARDAVCEETEASRQEFTPECLTLYINNRCNMQCRYCYSQPDANTGATVSTEGGRAAARLVSEACAARNRPFTLAVHGGGEPTLDMQHVDRILGTVREEASRAGISLRTYIATNGAVPEETANWLATQFDLIGVSCDGPPEIQNRYRPGRGGRPMSEHVGRTIDTLQRRCRPFHIRATISSETVDRQAEIVSYLADRYAPSEIRLEPVYANASGEAPIDVSKAAAFVSGFIAAQAMGAARAIPVTTSITRPDAVYGRYCNVLRRVLNLVPGDVATGCFLDSRPVNVTRRGVQTGSFDPTCGVFRLDEERIRSLIVRCSERPAGCGDCLCRCQCTYDCPDRCALEMFKSSSLQDGETGGLRCTVNRMLLEHMVVEAADLAWNRTPPERLPVRSDAQGMLSVEVYRDEVAS